MEQHPIRGVLAAVAAFIIWGVLPLYWHMIAYVSSVEITMHRVGGGLVVAWLVVALTRLRVQKAVAATGGTAGAQLPPVLPAFSIYRWHLISGFLLVGNWMIYIWAVNNGHTLDAGLGYYINPLVNVLVGMIFFRERLDWIQWLAVAFATAGVAVQTAGLGHVPWISLALAGSFAVYGAIKKQSPLGSVDSLAIELSVLGPLALIVIVVSVFLPGNGVAANFLVGDARATWVLFGAGVVTVTPLVLFGVAAKNIRLSDVGFIQYIGPTLMLVVGVYAFHEPLDERRLPGFILVWIGLAFYTYSTVWGKKH